MHTSMRIRRLCLWLGCLGIATLAGCIKRSVDGDTSTYSVEWWLPTLVGICGAALFAAGFVMQRGSGKNSGIWQGYPIMALAILGSAALIWFMMRDWVIVDREHFEMHVGTSRQSIRFDDIQSIRVNHTETTDSKGRPVHHYTLDCELKDHRYQEVHVGGEVAKAALPQLLEIFRSRSIPIENAGLLQRLIH